MRNLFHDLISQAEFSVIKKGEQLYPFQATETGPQTFFRNQNHTADTVLSHSRNKYTTYYRNVPIDNFSRNKFQPEFN